MTDTQELIEAFKQVNNNMDEALENLQECNRLLLKRRVDAEIDAVNDFLHERNVSDA